jgi:predicted nucleic acid-binding protein
MIAVSNTTPIHNLVLIEQTHLLPALYRHVLIPPVVADELNQPGTPEPIRRWLDRKPDWLELREPERISTDVLESLDPGERDAIALYRQITADVLLIDDWAGREEAIRLGLPVVGTLRVLASAAEQGLVELGPAIARLRTTNFRASEKLIHSFLDRAAERRIP